MDPFVSSDWLGDHLDEVVVCDVRWNPDGDTHPAYLAGHVPGAVHVDLDRDLASAPDLEVGRHPLPDAGHLVGDARAPRDRGRRHRRRLRRRCGCHRGAAGVDAPGRAGSTRRCSTGDSAAGTASCRPTPSCDARPIVPLRPWPAEVLADIDATASARPSSSTRATRARYRGDDAGPDRRAGHIPGAHHVPYADNVDADGRLRDLDELRSVYGPLADKATDDEPVVASCGSGVTACHDLLVMEQLGLPQGRLFPGSWSQWAADLARRVALGDSPAGD